VRAKGRDLPSDAARAELSPPFRWRSRNGLPWIEVSLPAGRAVFSTRCGGRSEGPYRSLNLGILTDDDPRLVAENRELLALSLERDPRAFAMGLQVHGAGVERHSHPPRTSAYLKRGAKLDRADAQVSTDPAVTPLVLVADCIPLVLSMPGAVAAVHCGWRGLLAGVVENAVEAVCDLAGGPSSRLSAALGPGIGPCCYEVGEEVRAGFEARGHGRALSGGRRLDLAGAVAGGLERSGVEPASISLLGLCTSCHPELFFSHRRDGGATGRQAGMAWLEA
jgi:YfiH family protein